MRTPERQDLTLELFLAQQLELKAGNLKETMAIMAFSHR